MKTIEDTICGLDQELRQLSLDIHGERKLHRGITLKRNEHAALDHPEVNFEERSVLQSREISPFEHDDRDS
jgi:hypothetical protein